MHIIDLMATCVDAAETPYPEKFNGNEITPLDGKSMLPLVTGKSAPIHDVLFWEHEGNCAVRMGCWKLVSAFSKEEQRWELYNMEEDRTETHDLSATYPDKVAGNEGNI